MDSDRTEYNIEMQGYIQDRRPLSAVAGDCRLTLRPPIMIAGTIVDAETNQPLAKCRLIKGYEREDGRPPQWETSIGYPTKTITNGRYEIEITQQQPAIRIRVEADEYMPVVSKAFKPYDPDQGRVICDFKLTKAAALSGTVVGPDNKPLASAEVYLAIQQFSVDSRKASPFARSWNRMVKTDADGRFEFPPEVEPFYLVAIHELGFGIASEEQFAGNPAIRIEPWTALNHSFLLERRPATR